MHVRKTHTTVISSNTGWRSAPAGRRWLRLGLPVILALVLMAMSASMTRAGESGLRITENRADRISVEFELGDWVLQPINVAGRSYARIIMTDGHSRGEVGAPDLPCIRRSLVVPDDAEMAVRLSGCEAFDVPDVEVLPARGAIAREIDPANVPYVFGRAYETDEDYPAEVVSLGEPYRLRDYRGQVLTVCPFQYYPVSRALRVFTRMHIEVYRVGTSVVNVSPDRRTRPSAAFNRLYEHHFLNFQPLKRYSSPDEQGSMLIICHDPWLPNVQPLVDHKNSIGVATTVVPVSAVGSTASAVKNYISNVYNSSDLAFVLLVLPKPSASGRGPEEVRTVPSYRGRA